MSTPSSKPSEIATGDTLIAPTLASERLPVPVDGADETGTRDGASHRSAPSALPNRLGRYHVLGRLGAGGMGVVFAAYDPDLDRRVAVKLLHVERGGHESQVRLLREAQALARLSHPNVVQIHDASAIGEQVFIAMEFVRGQDLRTWLSAQVRTDSEILRVFLDAGRGLAAAHAEGLVHRDFKPDNVLVGEDGRVRVADFGLARVDHELVAEPNHQAAPAPQSPLELSLTATGAVLGTPAYMSPEQHTGEPADARSDQFSFCVALWEALYRQRPFAGDSFVETSMAVVAGQIRPPPSGSRVPRRIAEVLRRGLLPRPEQRHPDMATLLAALERDPARTRRRWLAGAALLAMSTGTAFAFAEHRAGEASACTGGPTELAGTWDPERRDAVAAALIAEPALSDRVRAGLDAYAAGWAAAHRDACLDNRRGELPPVVFAARARCLDRRRLALGGAVAALVAGAPDPAQAVARLPALRACADPESALSETTLPEDPVLASAIRALDARLLAARARHHAGDLPGARAEAEAVTAEARRLEFRPLLAEALLVVGQICDTLRDEKRGREAVAEAVVHAIATGRHDLAAEALARRIYFDGKQVQVEAALAEAPIARALAERLAAPAAALARLEHNLGVVHLMQRDLEGARPFFERAVAALEHAPDIDPIERSHYWGNLALATREPVAREQAFARAATALVGVLGEHHPLVLEHGLIHGVHASDARTAAALLDEPCRRFLELYPASGSCSHCFHSLGHLRAALGERDAALDALARVDSCLEHAPADASAPSPDPRLTSRRERAAALADLLRDRPAGALGHADAALVLDTPDRSLWWVAGDVAEAERVRGLALLALGRPDEARAALERAEPVFQDLARTRNELIPALWLADVRDRLAKLRTAP